jgi:signal transduction histidine kinase
MKTKSIRWQLSLSYAGIALLAALLLGAIMLTILQRFYTDQELEYLTQNAVAIEQKMAVLHSSEKSPEVLEQILAAFAFFSNIQVRLLDPDGDILLDTGQPQEQTVLAFDAFPDSDKLVGFETGFTIVSTGFITNGVSVKDDIFGDIPAGGILILEESTGNFPGWVIGESVADPKSIPVSDPVTARSRQRIQHPYYNQKGEMLGIIELSKGPAYGQGILYRVAWGWAIAAFAAVLLAAAAGLWVSRRFSDPLISLTHTTTQMAGGKLSARADIKREDEFGLLANSFNTMADTIEAKVGALRRFVADAAHELGSPLTALRTNLELVDDEHIPPALEQVERMDALTRSLLDLSQLEASASEFYYGDVDLARLLRILAELYASRAEQAGLSFNLDIDPDPINITGNEAQLSTLIRNLLDNAIKFTPAGGQVNVKLTPVNETVQLDVADTGIGIPEEDIPHLFSRFHRGRNASAYPGNGLGLAIVKAIADQHGASIHVDSGKTGTQFIVSFKLEN